MNKNNSLVRVEFDNMVINVNNADIAAQIKGLITGNIKTANTPPIRFPKRHWTDDEDRELLQFFNNNTAIREIALLMQRSTGSVYARLWAKGLIGSKAEDKEKEEFTL